MNFSKNITNLICEMKITDFGKISKPVFQSILLLLLVSVSSSIHAQIDNNGCVGGNFGIDGGLFSGVIEYGNGSPSAGTIDWFLGSSGRGTIDESNKNAIKSLLQSGGNPLYEQRMTNHLSSIVDGQILIDAVFARDYFGGTGAIDISSYETSSKNGDDPSIWDLGQHNVLGKNDIVDVAGHMLRDGSTLYDDLWFYGVINRAEPGGSAYMDFEFYVDDVTFVSTPNSGDAGEGYLTSGGPNLGHTAFQFDGNGQIDALGDFIFNTSLINGGIVADVEMRLWVSYSDYTTINPANFTWGPEYDGAFNGAPYGYASIIPNNGNDACGFVNLDGQNPAAPPWGTLNTKNNSYKTSYAPFSILEVGINMTAFGIDHASILGSDPCDFPINTFMVKTRASASFTAQLKDRAGPFTWGTPYIVGATIGPAVIACDNPTVTIAAQTDRTDLTILWTTSDGNIIGDPTLKSITVDQPGTYKLVANLPTGCELAPWSITIGNDPSKPFFSQPTATTTVSCHGNDGTIDLTVNGGTPPYTYAWSNGSNQQDPTNLAPGAHTVTITDALLCSIISQTILVPAEMPAIITNIKSDVNCFGENTGSIDVSAAGQMPISYVWSNGSISEDLSNLYEGTYSVTTTDNDGCTETQSISVTQPTFISLSVVATDDTDPDELVNNGTIDLTVTGGTPGYTYDWDHNGTQDPDTDPEDLTGLANGVYEVTVTDANGCTEIISTTIYEPEICDDGIDNDGDGLTDCFDDDCIPPNAGSITASKNPVCVGDTLITYSIVEIGVDSYIWTVPTGATIVAGHGSASITVNWVANEGGQICVISETNASCQSNLQSCFTVDLHDVPPFPGAINLQGN